ncbi:hypothetical protein BaRGS_00007627, partial [Batillaria attramentaria]
TAVPEYGDRSMYGDYPQLIICQHCQATVTTTTHYRAGNMAQGKEGGGDGCLCWLSGVGYEINRSIIGMPDRQDCHAVLWKLDRKVLAVFVVRTTLIDHTTLKHRQQQKVVSTSSLTSSIVVTVSAIPRCLGVIQNDTATVDICLPEINRIIWKFSLHPSSGYRLGFRSKFSAEQAPREDENAYNNQDAVLAREKLAIRFEERRQRVQRFCKRVSLTKQPGVRNTSDRFVFPTNSSPVVLFCPVPKTGTTFLKKVFAVANHRRDNVQWIERFNVRPVDDFQEAVMFFFT